MAHIITYQSKLLQRNESLIGAIQSYQHWAILSDGLFIIRQEGVTPISIRDHLSRFCKPGDQLFVAELKREAAWAGYAENITTWLQSNL